LIIYSYTTVKAKSNKVPCLYATWCRGLHLIKDISDVERRIPNENYDDIADEFNELIKDLKRFKVKVYLGDKKLFPETYRGVYLTGQNIIYLNKKYMNDDVQLIGTLRHEAWHVAQDCFAGLRNGYLKIIVTPKNAPESFNDYEFGARVAARRKGMAQAALESCYTKNK